MIEVYLWQFLHIVLSERQPDPVVDGCDRGDRNRDLLAPPQMSLLEQHMRHVMIMRIDDQALYTPDVAIGGLHLLTPAHFHLADGNSVEQDRVNRVAPDSRETIEAVVGPEQHLLQSAPHLAARSGQELRFLRVLEVLELGARATQRHLRVRGFDHVHWDEPPESPALRGFDDEMGDRTRDRIDDHPPQLPAWPIAAADLRVGAVCGSVISGGAHSQENCRPESA